jgi:AcrR family transcriptional regulator
VGEDRRTKTRAAILRAAFQMLGRPEGRSSRIEEICEAAGVSRATFYNYFNSVEELFKATAFHISHDFNDAVRAVIIRVPGGAIRLAFALRYQMQKTREDPAWGWAMVNLSAGGPIFGEEAYTYATEAIEEGMLTEQFAVASVEVGLDIVMGTTLAAMITLLRSEQGEDYPEVIVKHIYRALGVSETLTQRCVTAILPDAMVVLREADAQPNASNPASLFVGFAKPID